MTTNISWTSETWNPITGCSKVSPGCAHCYAENLSLRFGWSKKPWTPENAEENVILHPERLSKPLSWRKPSRVFVNSMSDLFHELVPFEFIDKVFAIMALTPQHTYQVLTKRPERMKEYAATDNRIGLIAAAAQHLMWDDTLKGNLAFPLDYPLPNVWLGTSVENQRWADERIPHLLQTPAAVRFLSCEPLLGPVDLWGARYEWPMNAGGYGSAFAWGRGIQWVIVGGESGPNYREMDLQWARDIRDQCEAAGCAFFFKQQSARRSETNPFLDGVQYHEFPEVVVA